MSWDLVANRAGAGQGWNLLGRCLVIAQFLKAEVTHIHRLIVDILVAQVVLLR